LYYRKYCKTLAKIIKGAKKVYYDSVILKLNNKIKTTRSIIKKETGYKNHKDEPQSLKVNNIIIKDKGHIANAFNEYFSSVAQTIIDDLNKGNNF
jgi:superoxide dismutase